jgi:hypothetical protein
MKAKVSKLDRRACGLASFSLTISVARYPNKAGSTQGGTRRGSGQGRAAQESQRIRYGRSRTQPTRGESRSNKNPGSNSQPSIYSGARYSMTERSFLASISMRTYGTTMVRGGRSRSIRRQRSTLKACSRTGLVFSWMAGLTSCPFAVSLSDTPADEQAIFQGRTPS